VITFWCEIGRVPIVFRQTTDTQTRIQKEDLLNIDNPRYGEGNQHGPKSSANEWNGASKRELSEEQSRTSYPFEMSVLGSPEESREPTPDNIPASDIDIHEACGLSIHVK